MNASLLPLGVFHTIVSVLAIGAGLAALVRDGEINPRSPTGKVYLGSMSMACVTAFGLFRHGFGPGHVLGLLTLALLLGGSLAGRLVRSRAGLHVQTISFSITFLLLMVFATTETLTRLPAMHPIAASQEDPVLLPVRLGLLILFVLGVRHQVRRLRVAKGQHETGLSTSAAGRAT